MELCVVSTPASNLVYTNHAYLSKADHARLVRIAAGVSSSSAASAVLFVTPGKNLVWQAVPHDKIDDGHIGLSSIQRETSALNTNDRHTFARIHAPALPEWVTLNLELSRVSNGAAKVTVQAAELVPLLQKVFLTQVLAKGQLVCVDHAGTALRILVLGGTCGVRPGESADGQVLRSSPNGRLSIDTLLTLTVAPASKRLLDLVADDSVTNGAGSALLNPHFRFSDM
jgi:hypothetical protein